MSEILDKLTSYNLFNYLLPGAVFAYLSDRYFSAGLVQDDLVTAAFLYYFLGVIVSRFGSLVVEPAVKWFGLVKFENYPNYVAAVTKDPKIDVLMESANMYRTFTSMFVLLLLFGAYYYLELRFEKIVPFRGVIACAILGALFLFSYVKQASYVAGRVRKCSDDAG